MTDDTTRPLRDELGFDDTREEPAATAATTATHPGPQARDTTAGPEAPHGATPAPAPTPTYRSGPAPFALLLGILGLVTAVGVFVSQLTDLDLPWRDLGPWTVVAGGAVVVLVGLLGLRGSRRQD